jgi:hypothetical protein
MFPQKENIMTRRPEETAIARQWQPKHVSAAMNQHATIE